MTLSGCLPVLCTPFRADGRIDDTDMADLVSFVLAAGADGCVYPGVASEVDTLSADERSAMVAQIGATLRGRVPFVVGASADSATATIAHIEAGARAGAVAAMVMAPARLGNDSKAHIAHFTAITTASPIQVMLQNAPPPVGAGLAPDLVAKIAGAVSGVAWVKEETLPCGQNLTRIATAAGARIGGVFGGAGGRYITDELARGSLGTLPAAELTDLHARLVAAWNAGDTTEARRLFMVSMPLLNFQAVFRMHMTKEVLRRRAVLRHTHVRGAGPRPDAGDRRELAALLEQIAPEFLVHPVIPETTFA